MKKFVMFYTGGKNSTLALYKMIEKGYEPLELLVMLEEGNEVTWFNKVNEDLISKASFALNVNICLVETSIEDYDELFEEQLIYLKEQGAEACVFGDIDNIEHKNWCLKRCKKANIEAIFPLWNEERESLTEEFLKAGFKAIINKVENEILDEELLGKELTRELLKEVKEEKYHTFVIDGPIFNFPIPYEIKEKNKNDKYCYLIME